MEPQHNSAKLGDNRLVPFAIVIAGLLVAAAIFFGGKPAAGGSLTGNATAPAADAVGVIAPVTSSDHVLGNPSTAKLVIVEYSDLECPFCKVFQGTLHQVMSDYPGEIAWVFRQFPIAQLHPKAPNEAAASECAFDQGGNDAFWKFIDLVFSTTNSNNSLDPAQLPIIAGQIGLNVDEFNTCLSSGKNVAEINADVVAAGKAGAQGTPFSVIITKDGQKIPIDGAQPLDQVEATINGLLK